MNKFKYLAYILAVLFATLIHSCNKNEPEAPVILSLDLSEAKNIHAIQTVDEEETYELFKITDADSIVQVPISTNNGEDFYKHSSILGICNINEQYFLLRIINGPKKYYLIDKKTGTAYPFQSYFELQMPNRENHGTVNQDRICSDNKGNIYARCSEYDFYGLIRFDISDPTNITYDTISLPNERVYLFANDLEGNMAYFAKLNDNNIMRAISADGRQNKILFEVSTSSYYDIYRGADKNLYTSYKGIQRITFNPCTMTQTATKNIYTGCGYRLLEINTPETEIALGGCTSLAHYSDKGSTVLNIEFDTWDIIDLGIGKANNTNYFIVYKNSQGTIILGKGLPNSTQINPIISERYEPTDFDVLEDNTVYFTAFDNQEIKNVIGKISPQGDITILNNDSEANIVFFSIDL